MPIITDPVPAGVLSQLEDLDDAHEAALALFGLSARALSSARDELAEAERKLAAAEEAWLHASHEADHACSAAVAARKAAGVSLTAPGYVKAQS